MDKITIAGRQFVTVGESTLEHDYWTMRQIRLCGLENVVMLDGESPDEFAQRLMMDAAADSNVFRLLGGMLMPAGMKPGEWTPEIADQTGRFTAGVTAASDKAAVRGMIAEALASFFAQGLASLKTSPKSSTSVE